jgi:hypothetical protein
MGILYPERFRGGTYGGKDRIKKKGIQCKGQPGFPILQIISFRVTGIKKRSQRKQKEKEAFHTHGRILF